MSKSKINEFRKSLFNIKALKNHYTQEIIDTEENLFELEKSLSRLRKYYDYNDTEYRGIRDIRNLFNGIDEDYCKPIRTKSAFNSKYIK